MSETMALSPAPHQPPKFRILKQAWREYLASGKGLALTVSTPPGQAHTAALTVSGTVQADKSVPKPILVVVTLVQGGSVKATRTVGANVTTGAFTTTFPANTLAAGTAFASVTTTLVTVPVNSGTFTLT